MSSVLLTPELADEAVNLVMPSIEALFTTRAKRGHFHLVILDPTIKPWDGDFEDAILYECSIGRVDWEYDYEAVARSKAEQTWRTGTGTPNILLQLLGPASLEEGDTQYWSSFDWFGLTVGGSGVQPWFDFLINGWVALACQMLAYDESERVRQDENISTFWTV